MGRHPATPGIDGVLVVAKPAGPTSHDVVALVRRLAGTRRIGHGGTLDPFATGVLPLFLGNATKLVEYHLGDPKRYTATICFGATSTTDDLDGILTPSGARPVSRADVEAALGHLVGTIRQRPPAFSAVQVGGRRAYDMARAGERPQIAEREVTIESITLERWDGSDAERPIAVIDVRCSAGTYVRALARDVGEALGCGAYLGALTRTASGPFTLDAAVSLDAVRAAAAAGGDQGVVRLLLPPDAGLDGMPALSLEGAEVEDARQGRFVRPRAGLAAVPAAAPVRLLDEHGRIVGIGHRDGARIAPDKMFPPPTVAPAHAGTVRRD